MIIGVAVLLLVVILGTSFWYGSKPDMVPLFTNMETKDAGEVASKLKESNDPDSKKILETFEAGMDFVSEENLEPVLKWLEQ